MMYKEKSYCLFRDPYKTQKYNVITMQNFRMLNLVVRNVTDRILKGYVSLHMPFRTK